ncbi:possible gluconolactonase precursor [Pedobacter sp. BAL39]|nr:possible gluconolactonase precursor [Pedobacter sp. BAL39]
MFMRLSSYLLIPVLFTSFIAKGQVNSGLFVQDSLKLAGAGYAFTEGCSRDAEGNVFFTDQPNDKIWKYDVSSGGMTLFMDKTGRSNGTYFDKKGNLLVCADEKGAIWSVSPDGQVSILLDQFNGKQFNGPNDLWINNKGAIYFTDPYYQRDYWTRTKPDLGSQDVYYLAKGATAAVKVADGLKQPNGIVGTPDGRFLYVADIGDGKTYRYEILKNGNLASRKLIAEKGSDGMTLDERGNLYLTGGEGVNIFDSTGLALGTIKVPKGASNVCFAGKNRKLLFITAKDAVYTIPMQVSGVE